MARQGTLQFDQRFMPRYAGAIIHDPAVALVELVANAWDAYATRVDVVWPNKDAGVPFSIQENGKGMTPQQFELSRLSRRLFGLSQAASATGSSRLA